MPRPPCTIEDCNKPRHTKGLCSMHKYRLLRYGDPFKMGPRGTRGSIVAPLEERFWRKVDKAGPTPAHRPDLGPCWLWRDATSRKGYVSIQVGGGKSQLVHRLSYEWENGAIPDGFVIDHVCRQTSCVRPSHLEAVTVEENSRRARLGKIKPFCKRNHDQSIYRRERRGGGGYCGACALIRDRELNGRPAGPLPTPSLRVDPLGGAQDAQVIPAVLGG